MNSLQSPVVGRQGVRLMGFLVGAAVVVAGAAAQAAPTRPVVVELFTSEACSSCPPAEALLGQLAKQPGILALAFHVTYWNGPSWSDQYALTAATDRQSNYASLQHSDNVYTPEAVIDGGTGVVGSNQQDVSSAITTAAANQQAPVPVTVANGPMVTIKIGDGNGTAQVWLFGYDSKHITQVGGGENDGATLNETNAVRSINSLGGWTGISESFTMPKPAGEHMAVVLQMADGTILGAGTQ